MAREYNFKNRGKQRSVHKDHERMTQSPVREQEVPAKVDQGLYTLLFTVLWHKLL